MNFEMSIFFRIIGIADAEARNSAGKQIRGPAAATYNEFESEDDWPP
jgi:hypothetical protein